MQADCVLRCSFCCHCNIAFKEEVLHFFILFESNNFDLYQEYIYICSWSVDILCYSSFNKMKNICNF